MGRKATKLGRNNTLDKADFPAKSPLPGFHTFACALWEPPQSRDFETFLTQADHKSPISGSMGRKATKLGMNNILDKANLPAKPLLPGFHTYRCALWEHPQSWDFEKLLSRAYHLDQLGAGPAAVTWLLAIGARSRPFQSQVTRHFFSLFRAERG